jgi:molecular chaperone DnaK
MVRDAKANADEDRKRREEVEARNQLDTVAYKVENELKEFAEEIPANDKARAGKMLDEARQLVKENSTDLSRIRGLASDLQQLSHGLMTAASEKTASAGQPNYGGRPDRGGDDVIDADFRETR